MPDPVPSPRAAAARTGAGVLRGALAIAGSRS
jgi:hypothetical protein